jgi:hypothetical protein
MIFVDCVPVENKLPIARVEIDNEKAAYSATEFLIKLGHVESNKREFKKLADFRNDKEAR